MHHVTTFFLTGAFIALVSVAGGCITADRPMGTVDVASNDAAGALDTVAEDAVGGDVGIDIADPSDADPGDALADSGDTTTRDAEVGPSEVVDDTIAKDTITTAPPCTGVAHPLEGRWHFTTTRWNYSAGQWFGARGAVDFEADGTLAIPAGMYQPSSNDQPLPLLDRYCTDDAGALTLYASTSPADEPLRGQLAPEGDLVVWGGQDRVHLTVAVKPKSGTLSAVVDGARYRLMGLRRVDSTLQGLNGWLSLASAGGVASGAYLDTTAQQSIALEAGTSSKVSVFSSGDVIISLDPIGAAPPIVLRGAMTADGRIAVVSQNAEGNRPIPSLFVLMRESQAQVYDYQADYAFVGLAQDTELRGAWGTFTFGTMNEFSAYRAYDTDGASVELTTGCPSTCPGWVLTKPPGNAPGGGAYLQQLAMPAGLDWRAGQVLVPLGGPPYEKASLIVTYPVDAGDVGLPPSAAGLNIAVRRAPTP